MAVREPLRGSRRSLQISRSRLERELSFVGTLFTEPPRYGTDMADAATEVFEQTKNQAIRQTLQHSLSMVHRALDKMEKGTYGICEACGSAIDPERLKALPHAMLCVACQARLERRA